MNNHDINLLIQSLIDLRGKLTPLNQRAHISAFMRICVTQDEHDSNNPFKPIPYNKKPHIKELVNLWLQHPLLIIAKSRQMMVTWTFCACFLWDTLFKLGRTNIIVVKKEDEADDLVSRVKFIYKNLPEKIRVAIPAKISPHGEYGSYCRFEVGDSKVLGLTQNPDAIRRLTASNILSDEMAFQERARETYIAMKPTIDGGGHLVACSTPNGREFFYKLYHGEEG